MLESARLKEVGLKVTSPRIKILKILSHVQGKHLSAEEVYKALMQNGDEIGIATVYRVLTQFEKAGLINKHNFENGAFVFELSQKPHHDHLVCLKCGGIEEFVDDIIEKRQILIAEKANFLIKAHSLNIYGFCVLCKA